MSSMSSLGQASGRMKEYAAALPKRSRGRGGAQQLVELVRPTRAFHRIQPIRQRDLEQVGHQRLALLGDAVVLIPLVRVVRVLHVGKGRGVLLLGARAQSAPTAHSSFLEKSRDIGPPPWQSDSGARAMGLATAEAVIGHHHLRRRRAEGGGEAFGTAF